MDPLGVTGGRQLIGAGYGMRRGGLRHDQAHAVKAMFGVASYTLAEGIGVCACYEQKE